MTKTYTINGVQVSYDTYDHAMNGDPNDFGDLNNIDAPDIPQVHKDCYQNDLRNERAGRGHTWWTPRRRMIDSIKHKEQQIVEKKQKRLEKRQAKLDAWGEQRSLDIAYENEQTARNEYYARQQQNQVAEDNKSVRYMMLIFGIAFLLMCLSAVVLARLQGAG